MPKTFGDRLKAWTFRLIPKRVVGIGAIHDFAEEYQCWIAGEIILFQYRLERTFFTKVPQLDVFNIEGCGIQSPGFFRYLAGRNKEKLGLWVHKLSNEPGTGYAIYFHPFSGNPFHSDETCVRIVRFY